MILASLYGAATVPASTVVGEQCVLGYPKEARLRVEQTVPGSQGHGEPVVVGERCILFNQVVIYEGVRVGDGCVVEDRVRVGYGSRIGPRTRLLYGAYLCDRVTVGEDARIAGFVCDGSVVGDRSSVMGQLVHEYARPHEGWWEVDEPAPVIETDTVVGFGAVVVGGVRVGPHAYVAAGAVVTKDVAPEHVVTGVNGQSHADDWPGRRLQTLIRAWRS